jgi:hypothetical protein
LNPAFCGRCHCQSARDEHEEDIAVHRYGYFCIVFKSSSLHVIGTLNLKFMQRARTSGREPIPSLEKKKIIDEGEWDVGSEVRKIWGLAAGSDLK